MIFNYTHLTVLSEHCINIRASHYLYCEVTFIESRIRALKARSVSRPLESSSTLCRASRSAHSYLILL